MKRISTACACLVVMCAFGAMAATTAYAGEYGECKRTEKVGTGKTAHYTGRYAMRDSGCTGTQTPEGEYEWYPIAAKTAEWGYQSKGIELKGATNLIRCRKPTSSSGYALNTQLAFQAIGFTKCFNEVDSEPCTGWWYNNTTMKYEERSTKEEIAAEGYAYLVDHGTTVEGRNEPAEGEVWNVFYDSNAYPALTLFKCQGVASLYRVTGDAVSKVTTVKTMTKELDTNFGAPPAAASNLQLEESGDGGATWRLVEAVSLGGTLDAKLEKAQKIEVRPCNDTLMAIKSFPSECENEIAPPWA